MAVGCEMPTDNKKQAANMSYLTIKTIILFKP